MVTWYDSYTTICLWISGVMLILFFVGLIVSSRVKETLKEILAKNNRNDKKKMSFKERYSLYNYSEKCLVIYCCVVVSFLVLAILPILFCLLFLTIVFSSSFDGPDHVSYTNIKNKDGSVTSITSRTYVNKETGKSTTYSDGYTRK